MRNSEIYEKWTQYVSPEGWTYYYNNITGETTWDLPGIIENIEIDKDIAVYTHHEITDDASSNPPFTETGGEFYRTTSNEQSTYYNEAKTPFYDPEETFFNSNASYEPNGISSTNESSFISNAPIDPAVPPPRNPNSIFFNPTDVSTSINDPLLFFESNFNSNKDPEQVELFFENSGYSDSGGGGFFFEPSQENISDPAAVVEEDGAVPHQLGVYGQVDQENNEEEEEEEHRYHHSTRGQVDQDLFFEYSRTPSNIHPRQSTASSSSTTAITIAIPAIDPEHPDAHPAPASAPALAPRFSPSLSVSPSASPSPYPFSFSFPKLISPLAGSPSSPPSSSAMDIPLTSPTAALSRRSSSSSPSSSHALAKQSPQHHHHHHREQPQQVLVAAAGSPSAQQPLNPSSSSSSSSPPLSASGGLKKKSIFIFPDDDNGDEGMARHSPSRSQSSDGPQLEPRHSPIRILSQSYSSSVSFEENHLTTPVRGNRGVGTGGVAHPNLLVQEDPVDKATASRPDLTEIQEQRAVLLAIRQSCLDLDDSLLAELLGDHPHFVNGSQPDLLGEAPPLLTLCSKMDSNGRSSSFARCLKLLLEHGADYKVADMEDAGRTIMHKCVLNSLVDTVAYLLSWIRNHDVHSNLLQIVDRNGDTPLQLAARLGDLSCLQVLLLQSTKPADEHSNPNLSPSPPITAVINQNQRQPNLPAAQKEIKHQNHVNPGTDYSTAQGVVGQGDTSTLRKATNKKYLREKIMESIHSSRDDSRSSTNSSTTTNSAYNKEYISRHPDLPEGDSDDNRSSSSVEVKNFIASSAQQITVTRVRRQELLQKQFLREKKKNNQVVDDSRVGLPAEKVEVEAEWQEYFTDSGDAYYYNTRTGIVQWERPDSMPVETSKVRVTHVKREEEEEEKTTNNPSNVSIASSQPDRTTKQRKGMRTYVVDVNLTQHSAAQSYSNSNSNTSYNANASTWIHSSNNSMRARHTTMQRSQRSHSDLSSLSDVSSYGGDADLTQQRNRSKFSSTRSQQVAGPSRGRVNLTQEVGEEEEVNRSVDEPNLSSLNLSQSFSSVNLTQEAYYKFRAQYAPDTTSNLTQQLSPEWGVDLPQQPPSLIHPSEANAENNAYNSTNYYHDDTPVEQPNPSAALDYNTDNLESEQYFNENASVNLTLASSTGQASEEAEDASKIRHLQVWNRFFENAFSAHAQQGQSPSSPSPSSPPLLDATTEFKLAAKQLGLRYETLKSSKTNSNGTNNAKGLWYHSISEDSYANLTYLSLNGLGLGEHISPVIVLNVALRATCLRNDDASGCTPLYLAARSGYPSCCRILLQFGADRARTNHAGQSALTAAAELRKRHPSSQRLKEMVRMMTTDMVPPQEDDDGDRDGDDDPVVEKIEGVDEDDELPNESDHVESPLGQGVSSIGQGITSSISHGAQAVASAVLAITAWLLSVILRALPSASTKRRIKSSAHNNPWPSDDVTLTSDSELLKLGLGFDTGSLRTLTPPDIIAADINSYRSNASSSSSSSSSAAASIHTSSYLSPPPQQLHQSIPTEVRAAVEMAKAQRRGNIPSNKHSHSSIRNAPINRSTSNSSISEMGSPYSLGKSLPRGVSWRYVDVMASSSASPPTDSNKAT
eukprot:gene28853-37861_t